MEKAVVRSRRLQPLTQMKSQVKCLGVSNFGLSDLQELLRVATIPPAVVQSHSDPLSPAVSLQRFCKQHGIAFQAYSSMGTQHAMAHGGRNPVLTNPTIKSIAERYDVTTGQVVLGWAIQNGQLVIPRSSKREHIMQNLHPALLSEEDLRAINRMSKSTRR